MTVYSIGTVTGGGGSGGTTVALVSVDGTLGAGTAVLYTCPGGKTAKVWFALNNPTASNRTVNMFRNDGTLRRLLPINMTVPITSAYPTDGGFGPISLTAGESIDGDSDSAGQVEYHISAEQYG